MPIDLLLNDLKSIRTHVCSGIITPSDILQVLHKIYSNKSFTHAQHAIWDFRNCVAHISGDEMQKIINYVQGFRKGPGGGKVALVVSGDLEYGLARMYDLLSEYQIDRELMVFKDYDEALRWIG